MPIIRISDNLHKRLENHAIGFDTPANVIEKLLNQIEGVEVLEETKVNKSRSLLPITLIPEDTATFKDALLKSKKAIMYIKYQNGDTEEKKWNASRFREDSGVIGNLRSRPEFRNGAWQKRGIKDVLVKIA